MAFQPVPIKPYPPFQPDSDRIAIRSGVSTGAARLYFHDLVGALENAFGEQETGRQFKIVAGGAHGDRKVFAPARPLELEAQSQLQRLLDGQQVLLGAGGRALHFLNRDGDDVRLHRSATGCRRFCSVTPPAAFRRSGGTRAWSDRGELAKPTATASSSYTTYA